MKAQECVDKEKQIKEIAKVIARRSASFRNPDVAFMTTATKTAESIYNAGYRKESELISKIFDDLDNFIKENETGIYSPHGVYMGKGVEFGLFKDRLTELKKKYEEAK